MKKSKYIYRSLLITTFFLGSCKSDFLDVEPMTSVLESNFYKNAADADMALVGCYDGYQRTTSNGSTSFYVTSEVLSDNCFGGTGNTDNRSYQLIDRFDLSQAPSYSNLFNGTWTDYYAGIFRCNILLSKLDATEFGADDEAVRPRIEGEARFLRALMYFDLVRLFENIPLVTEPTSENLPQANPKDVYQLIVDDLKFAAANIPEDAYPKAQAQTNDGRATTYAAKALLARVYLFYTGYYAKDDLGITQAQVLDGLQDIIESEEFELIPDFSALWPASSYIPNVADNTLDKSQYAGKGNKEVVFAQKFNSTQDYNGNVDGNAWLVLLGLRNTNFSPYGKGWGACTVSQQLVADFNTEDTRKAASIIDIEGEGIQKFDIKDQREYTGYTNKKYSPTALPDGTSDTGGSKDFQISQDQDYIVIRYADVLLMAAELGSPNAQEYLDDVRRRAYKDNFTAVAPTKENILKERRFEFAFEGIRYWDLLRQGIQTAASTIATTEDVLSGNTPDQVVIDAQKILETRGFMMIPVTQITLANGKLQQNDGWK